MSMTLKEVQNTIQAGLRVVAERANDDMLDYTEQVLCAESRKRLLRGKLVVFECTSWAISIRVHTLPDITHVSAASPALVRLCAAWRSIPYLPPVDVRKTTWLFAQDGEVKAYTRRRDIPKAWRQLA